MTLGEWSISMGGPLCAKRVSVVKRVAFALTLFGAAVMLSVAASACPDGTVFSAYKGNGICAWIGRGKEAAVQCTIREGSCPKGTSREHSKNDKDNEYCCSKKTGPSPRECYWEGTAPICDPTNCRAGFHRVKTSKVGDGLECATGFKIYCCNK
jgi:hypothetical protein